jgi:hypothetical protein
MHGIRFHTIPPFVGFWLQKTLTGLFIVHIKEICQDCEDQAAQSG